MAQASFSAAVGAWVAETKERMVAVRNIAAERTIEFMQNPVGRGGNMPVDTGFLRASLQASIGRAAFVPRANPGAGSFAYEPGEVTMVLIRARITDPVEVVYTANYARHVEYGAMGRPGRAFVRLAAQTWQRNVDLAAAELRTRVTAPAAGVTYQTGA